MTYCRIFLNIEVTCALGPNGIRKIHSNGAEIYSVIPVENGQKWKLDLYAKGINPHPQKVIYDSLEDAVSAGYLYYRAKLEEF